MIRFLAFLPVSIVGTLAAYPLAPIAVALADSDGRLPLPLQWLETHDAPGWIGPMTEVATIKTTERFGRRIGMVHWLWRNKAYRLRHWMRARITRDMPIAERGTSIPARWGFSYWRGDVGPYWELQPRLGLGRVHIYLRIGWKLKPIFDAGRWPDGLSPVGMYTGITPRMDDWDDYPEAQP